MAQGSIQYKPARIPWPYSRPLTCVRPNVDVQPYSVAVQAMAKLEATPQDQRKCFLCWYHPSLSWRDQHWPAANHGSTPCTAMSLVPSCVLVLYCCYSAGRPVRHARAAVPPAQAVDPPWHAFLLHSRSTESTHSVVTLPSACTSIPPAHASGTGTSTYRFRCSLPRHSVV